MYEEPYKWVEAVGNRRQYLDEQFKQGSPVVALAYDGQETLDLADRLDPDAVVVDLHMPNMDGVTAIRKLREEHPRICLIALTGDESTAIHDRATEAGADDVLVKGQMLEALVERLRGARTP